MSRIFEALQRSESEKSGGTPLESMLATELLESVDRDAPEPPVLNVGQWTVLLRNQYRRR